MVETRTRRPVVLVGYGESGLAWLRRTAQRYAETRFLDAMVRDAVVQFWALGVEPGEDPGSPVVRQGVVPDAPAVRERLDAARLARFRTVHGLDLREPILVIERWSLFGSGWEVRLALREAFATARHVDCDPRRDRELDYLWITLADAVRPAAPLGDAAVSQLRRSLAARTLQDVRFLIDRQTAEGSIIDAALADRCYFDFASALVTSDLGFPKHGIGDQRSTVFSADVHTDLVHPISVLTLKHPVYRVLEAIAQDVQRELVHREPALPLRQWAEAMPRLTSTLESEVEARTRARFSMSQAREQRTEALVRALMAALILRDADSALADVARTRRRVRESYPVADGEESGRLAPLALAALQPEGGILTYGALALTAILLIAGAAVLGRRSRPPGPVIPPGHAADDTDEPLLAGLRGQWERALDRLESALREWRAALGAGGTPAAAPDGVWRQAPEHPYEWVFEPRAGILGAEISLGEKAYRTIADQLLARATPGFAEGAVNDAVRAYARELMVRRPELHRTALTQGIAGTHADAPRTAVQQAPLLVNAGRIVNIIEVLWLADPEHRLGELLPQLEPATLRPLARVLTSDDASQTFRIAIGEPLPWQAVLSLDFLAA